MIILIEDSPLYSGHQHRGIGMYTRQLLAALGQTEQQIFTTQDKPQTVDLVHYPYFDLFKRTLPLTLNKKTVVTIHDVIPLEFPDHYKPGVKGSANFLMQQASLQLVNAIITDSDYSKQQISQNLNISHDKIFVVSLAGNPELTAANATKPAQLQQKYDLPKQYILYVGDINYNKNIPELIRALSLLPPQIKLVCVGKNFREQAIPEWQAIKQAIETDDLPERVIMMTKINNNSSTDLAGIFKQALCYVQPSLSEGFGLPVLEAMQCHTPVNCTERGSLPEVGGDFALYADPNAEALAANVTTIASWSTKERAKFVQAAAKWAESFSWKKTADQTIAVYNHVLS